MKKNKAFTLIELIAVLVILAIISLIVAPLILNTIRRVKDVANMRSIDGYGRAVEYAMANYQLKHLTYPDSFDELEIEYSGNKVECEISRINPDHTIYLSECKVNGRLVKNDKEFDEYYHYGILKMTNQEYVDTYGKNLEEALRDYYEEHDEYPEDYTTLELPPLDKEVSCDVDINPDGTVYLENCNLNSEVVVDGEGNSYHYGNLYATTELLKKKNNIEIAIYTDGDTHEMYTFNHQATEQTPALTDYRYIGDVPYNYVRFNGNEIWRIIGVFDVENESGKTERRIKIIKEGALKDSMAYDTDRSNDFSTSSIKEYLNGDYYDSLGDDIKGLCGNTKYYLGGQTNGMSAQLLYEDERGTAVSSGRSLNWTGKIALMYPSDYIYTYSLGVDDVCYNNGILCHGSYEAVPATGWIYNSNSTGKYNQWLITPLSYESTYAIKILDNSRLIAYTYNVIRLVYIRPVLYLKKDVKIKSGDGTIDNPYEFEL